MICELRWHLTIGRMEKEVGPRCEELSADPLLSLASQPSDDFRLP